MAWRAWLIAAVAFVGSDIARAEGASDRRPSLESWSGGEIAPHAWSAYSGLLYAFSGDVTAEGFRIRLAGGTWVYRDTILRWNGHTVVPADLRGTASFADLLLGYQFRRDALTVKVYGGATFQARHWTPADVHADLQGDVLGGKLVLEGWLDVSPSLFAQVDASWSSPHNSHNSRLRLGWRILPWLSVGPEAGYGGDTSFAGPRGGAFVRTEWSWGEASISGGVMDDGSDRSAAYGTLNVLARF